MNNIGLTHFFKFVELGSQITDPEGAGLDAVQPLMDAFDKASNCLKNSVYELENFEDRFKQFATKTE